MRLPAGEEGSTHGEGAQDDFRAVGSPEVDFQSRPHRHGEGEDELESGWSDLRGEDAERTWGQVVEPDILDG